MNFNHLVEGPLLSFALSVFFAGLIVRIALFVLSTSRDRRTRTIGTRNPAAILGRALLPHHGLAGRTPIYTAATHLFHLCILVVPIWLYGHIAIWEDSIFELSWPPLPDIWADRLTLLALGLAACFLGRRIFLKRIRSRSSGFDYLLLVIVAIPFASGYSLAHGTFETAPLLGDSMETIHLLSGEALLVTTAFLLCRVRLREEDCIGCASCELACPTGALETEDGSALRSFLYSHHRCICCGACARTCPETAAELKHAIAWGNPLRLSAKEAIHRVEMSICEGCGVPYLPLPQLAKVGRRIDGDQFRSCPSCKTAATAEKLYRQDPRRDRPPSMLDAQHAAAGAGRWGEASPVRPPADPGRRWPGEIETR